MSALAHTELHFLLDDQGSLIVYQESGAPWAGVLAFSSEPRAREFLRQSNLAAAEIAAIATSDRDAIAELIKNLKPRAIRNLLLDLDYRTGRCTRVEFEGEALGAAADHQFEPNNRRRG
ncbi:MAG TPA: hypothetical protein VEJ86_10355 [Candidatus Binataceae bacterium]|nr:hypothetical protein [Candidatus Binataceae bacterium]